MLSHFPGASHAVGSEGLRERPRAHPLRSETPSLPVCSPAAAGGFTVNKTTAENDLSSGRRKKEGREENKNTTPFKMLLSLIQAAHPSPGFHQDPELEGDHQAVVVQAQSDAAALQNGVGKGKAELVPTGDAKATSLAL